MTNPAGAGSGNPDPSRALFGRRMGKGMRPGQSALIETRLPALALPESLPARLEALFGTAVREIFLEIGMGGGEHLAAEMARQPETGFIGCEPFVNGMAKFLATLGPAEAGALPGNLRLLMGDAAPLLERLPDASLARVDLLYPDPWPKRRQRKRRFVSPGRLGEIARVLKPGGRFRFATDIDDYAAWTLERVAREPRLEWTAARADDWRLPWTGWTRTRYEAKAVREGRRPSYLVFERV